MDLVRRLLVGESVMVRGEVVHVDRFGNLVTSIRPEPSVTGALVEIAGREAGLVGTYAEIPRGELAGLIGSSGLAAKACAPAIAEHDSAS